MITENAEKRLALEHKKLMKYRAECAKKPAIGKRMKINGVNCIVHLPETDKKLLPVFFNIHGGAWTGGDAVETDSFCKFICDSVPAVSVNINYTKLDCAPMPNPINEIMRVMDYFAENSASFCCDSMKFAVCGQSAGANLAAAAAIKAKDSGFPLAAQILVYPFTDWTGLLFNPMPGWSDKEYYEAKLKMFFGDLNPADILFSPAAADEKELEGLAPAYITVCGKDELREHGVYYCEKLKKAGVKAVLREYPEALHGFLEINRPDHPYVGEAKNAEQDSYARDCENCISDVLKNL